MERVANEREVAGTFGDISKPTPRIRSAPMLRLAHRARPQEGGARSVRCELTIAPEGVASVTLAPLSGIARFLIDAAAPWLATPDLARLLGAAFFAFTPGAARAAISLRAGDAQVHAWLARPHFAVEHNAFGRVDILYEDETLGLYVLAIAPGQVIPAHMHRVMLESELVLDAGLLQQGCPVAPGAAFHWPKGFVHEYRNPGDAERRVLCLDRPRFLPEDEVQVTAAAELLPLAPAANYFV